MHSSVLFLVTEDPRRSPRPAEAIRIAAGIAPWRKTEILVYLRDAAVLLLAETAEDLVEGDSLGRYLPILAELGRPICVQGDTPFRAELRNSPVRFEMIGDADLARLAANSDYVARF
ncbi:MAG: hypothetical protein KGS61_12055 [Verrucomicrobia bacterium]|nr:hypothetical protein [Verrucomicrobiota bacterium]